MSEGPEGFWAPWVFWAFKTLRPTNLKLRLPLGLYHPWNPSIQPQSVEAKVRFNNGDKFEGGFHFCPSNFIQFLGESTKRPGIHKPTKLKKIQDLVETCGNLVRFLLFTGNRFAVRPVCEQSQAWLWYIFMGGWGNRGGTASWLYHGFLRYSGMVILIIKYY